MRLLKEQKLSNVAEQLSVVKQMKQATIEQFVATYQELNHDNLHRLATIYHQDICFVDPLHKIKGLSQLEGYFKHLYENLIYSQFNVTHLLQQGDWAGLYWQMTLQHRKLMRGEIITFEGHSQLQFQDNLVIFHKDYFDLGAMLYENLPIMGRLVKFVKGKAGAD